MTIPFTQFMQPDGHQVPTWININAEVDDLAAQVIKAGGKFEAEVLRNGIVSLECINTNVDEDDYNFTLAIELCTNDETVLKAVEKLVRTAHDRLGLTIPC